MPAAKRFIVEEPATLEEVKDLFEISDRRAAKLSRWVNEAHETTPRVKYAKRAKASRKTGHAKSRTKSAAVR